jgi:tRNA A37 threonylcarbamoyladenosine synthetase subunit TsaC/SUA5/YrdC
VARALSAGIGRPITATSANLSGQAPANTLDQARAALGKKVKVYLEGGKLTASAPSTVIAVGVDGRWSLIRAGAISERQIAVAMAGDALK